MLRSEARSASVEAALERLTEALFSTQAFDLVAR
jgi:hypothetical protein